MMNSLRLPLFVLAVVCAGFPAWAEAPRPAHKETSLETVREKLGDSRAAAAATEARMRKAEAALKTISKDLSVLSQSVRKNQDTLDEISRSQKSLVAEKKEIESKLESNYGSVARTIIAARRLDSLPPELLILRPGAPLEAAQTALILRSTLPVINRQNQTLGQDLQRLQELAALHEANKAKALTAQEKLDQESAALEKLLEERRRNFETLESDYRQQNERAEELARQARSLEELVTKIRTVPRDDEERTVSHDGTKTDSRVPSANRTALPALGRGLLPATGRILVGYGDKTDIGARSEGLSVAVSPGGLVVAPVGGIIKFAGLFKNYGQLIIIEHRKGFHSLIAGLGKPGVNVGQSVSAGEPLGYMASASSQEGAATLYYEVRQNGQPVDPARLIPGLKS